MKKFKYNYLLIKKAIEDKDSYEVIGKDGFRWSSASNPKGALLGALASGVQLNEIQIKMYVKDFNEVLARSALL